MSAESPGATPTRVLLVDDYESMRMMLRVMFEVSGSFTVVGEATTASEAIGQVRSAQPDVVILDLSVDQALPTIPVLRREAPGARIIVYSAQSAATAARPAIEAGADDYVEKGPPRDLLARISALMPAHAPEHADDDGTAAVIAHGMLNTLSVVQGAAGMLDGSWNDFSEAQRRDLTRMMQDQGRALLDMVGLLPAVAAHRLLNNIAPVFGASDLLTANPTLAVRHQALQAVLRAAVDASQVLRDLMRGLPEEARAILDELSPAPLDL